MFLAVRLIKWFIILGNVSIAIWAITSFSTGAFANPVNTVAFAWIAIILAFGNLFLIFGPRIPIVSTIFFSRGDKKAQEVK